MIDPHVHLRDWSQSPKETLKHGFTVAARAGISALFEMPNTDPPLTTEDAILRRLDNADTARRAASRLTGMDIFHGLYAGITADSEQLAQIVALHRRHFPRIVGLKFYAGHSTGSMGVISLEDQRMVWSVLAQQNYKGVVAIHAENEEMLLPDRYDPQSPVSYGRSRPPEAEINSIRRHIALAQAAGFQGSVHFCHVSTAEGIDTITASRDVVSFRLRAGVTPHHVLLHEEIAHRSPYPEWIVNPPLRDEATRSALWDRLCGGDFDWIESDHAPHTFDDKKRGAAGLPGIPAFRLLRDRLLRELGPLRTEQLTHQEVIEAFGIDAALVPPNDNSVKPYDFGEGAREYPWDPYRFTIS